MAKVVDRNGFITYKDCVISKEGVFEYRGSNVSPSLSSFDIVKVYRPFSEMEKAVDSFQQIPVIFGHTMLGTDQNTHSQNTPYDSKKADGILFNVRAENGKYIGDLKIYSEKLNEHIKNGNKALSLGYYCKFIPEQGNFGGQEYSYKQVNLEGNHIASVKKARCGNDVKIGDEDDTEMKTDYVMDNFDIEVEDEFVDFRHVKEILSNSSLSDEQKSNLLGAFQKKLYKRNTEEQKKDKDFRTVKMPTDSKDEKEPLTNTEEKQMEKENDIKKDAVDEQVDKQHIINDIGGILKGRIDEETLKTVLGKIGELVSLGSEKKIDDQEENTEEKKVEGSEESKKEEESKDEEPKEEKPVEQPKEEEKAEEKVKDEEPKTEESKACGMDESIVEKIVEKVISKNSEQPKSKTWLPKRASAMDSKDCFDDSALKAMF